MVKPIKVKDLKVGMRYQLFSWKPFEEVVSIRPAYAKGCVLINNMFSLSEDSYTYVEVDDDASIQYNKCSD